MTTKVTATQIDTLRAAFEILREATHDRVELQTVDVLLYIARRGETSAAEISKYSGLTTGAVSRTIARLSDVATRSGRGYGLVVSEEDWKDRRNKTVKLTKRGQELMLELVQRMRRTQSKED